MNRFLLYGHGGCENHGCEAIVRSTVRILEKEFGKSEVTLLKQDSAIGIDGNLRLPVSEIVLQKNVKKLSLSYLLSGISYVLTRKTDRYFESVYADAIKKIDSEKIALSIGGDNYCYGQHNSLYFLDRLLDRKKCKRVLWGCSIEPSSLSDEDLVRDLDGFDLIVGREPITVESLQKVLKHARVVLKPDPAFALEAQPVSLPEDFKRNGIVGINISPVITNTSGNTNVAYENYHKLLAYIIAQTNYNILLVPHVTWQKNNDMEPLQALYDTYKNTGRIRLVSDFDNCCELKGYIAECDLFIGARTHSTIAAYSSCVPTVAVGYSVKAEGIARRLFGDAEGYVVAARTLADDTVLTESFKWLDGNRERIKAHLESIMPAYIAEAFDAAGEIKNL